MRIVALALGNAVRGDDAAGLALGRGLGELVPGLEVIEVQELLPEHAEAIADADGVLFLDASVAGAPGEVRGVRVVPRPARAAVIHALMPEEILGLALALHGRAPPAALVTIAGRDFAFGEALSPEVEAALPLAREKARELAAGFELAAPPRSEVETAPSPPRGPVLTLPGLWSSGPDHWQSHWERRWPGVFRRVNQRDWERPAAAEWIETLDRAVTEAGPEVVLAAHSLACTLVALWATRSPRPIRGALLVAPSDVEAPSYPDGPAGFQPMPLARLPFPSIVVASSDDPYVSLARARRFAEAWGSRLVEAGPLGHLNSESRLGEWPLGLGLVVELERG